MTREYGETGGDFRNAHLLSLIVGSRVAWNCPANLSFAERGRGLVSDLPKVRRTIERESVRCR